MKKNLLFLALVFIACSTIAQPFYSDVAPIFYKNCTSCHNQFGHGAPFLNYTPTAAYSPIIQDKLTEGEMPPWSPDSTYARFVHERYISKAEKDKILEWIANGSAKGDTTLAPSPPFIQSTR